MMSTYPSGQGSDTRMLDFFSLLDPCFALIISLTGPRDACRSSLVSTFFNSVASSDEVWIKFLADDHPNLVPALPPASSLKELYLSLCDNHVLIEDGKKSISLDKKSGNKCYTQAPRDLRIEWVDTHVYWRWISRYDSRISTHMLSPMTHYKAYLVFKMTTETSGLKDLPIEATGGFGGTEYFKRTVYVDVGSEDEVENGDQYPRERSDGWFEVVLGEFFNERDEDGELNVRITQFSGHWKRGIFIEGIEIKPHY